MQLQPEQQQQMQAQMQQHQQQVQRQLDKMQQQIELLLQHTMPRPARQQRGGNGPAVQTRGTYRV
jgi:hypothetical protein